MTEVALALPLDDAGRLSREAAHYGHRVLAECAGADELATRLAALEPELVIVSASPQYLNARLLATCDELGVRLVVVGDATAERRHAGALGIVDTIPAPVTWAALAPDPVVSEPGLPAADGVELPRTPRVGRGRIVAVWGPGGAPGRTSLAIAIAAEFAVAGRTVALADADTHGAAVAPSLSLLDEAPGFAAACRLAGMNGLTPAEFDRIALSHRVGGGAIRVLTGLGHPRRWPELTADRIAGVLTAARGWVDATVIDVAAGIEQDEELSSDVAAPRRNAATLAVLASADRVVAVGAADPIGLSRFLRGHAELLEHTTPDRVTVVANKLRAAAIGLDPAAQVRQTLERFGGIRDPVWVPWDPAAFDAALLSGRTLVDAAPRSPARQAVRRLVLERLGGGRG